MAEDYFGFVRDAWNIAKNVDRLPILYAVSQIHYRNSTKRWHPRLKTISLVGISRLDLVLLIHTFFRCVYLVSEELPRQR
jgi:hypothetical protein